MTLLLLTACIKDPPPFEVPLGDAVPADFLGVDVEGLESGDTPLPSAGVGAMRLVDPGFQLAGAVDAGGEVAADPFAALAGYGGAVLGILGPAADGREDSWVADAAALIGAVPEVDAWEVWSAPNLEGVDATELATATCALADEVGADVLASPSPSWVGGEDAPTWLGAFLDAGGGDCVGAFSVQVDEPGRPEALPEPLAAVRDQLKDAGHVSLPIWNVGMPLAPGGVDEAGYVARWTLLQWPVGTDRAYVHSWGGEDVTLVEANNPTAAGDALDVLAGWVVGRDLSGCVADGTAWTCTVRTADARSLIVWDETGLGEIGVPADVATVRHLDGSSEAAGTSVSLTTVPVLLDGGT